MTARDWIFLSFCIALLAIYGLYSWYGKKHLDELESDMKTAVGKLSTYVDQEAARTHE